MKYQMKEIKTNSIAITFIVALFLLFFGASKMNAQSFTQNGTNFTQVSKSLSQGTKTKFTFTDSKGNKYPIYITEKGRCYVMKVSSKTNKEYKYYLKEDLSRQVCKELGITYVPKETKKDESKS